MKKTISLLLVLALAFALMSGCAAKAPETPAPTPTAAPAPVVEDAAEATEAAEVGVSKPDGYPKGTISWIVPAAAGAQVDLPVRQLVDMLDLGATIVVENIAGAAQTLGATEAANRKADGYTLLAGANAWGLIQPNMNEVAYSFDDFRHIAMQAGFIHDTLVVKADSPIQNIDDLLAFISSGDRYTYGVPAAGGHGHLAITSALKQLGSTTGACVAYSNGGECVAAILGDVVDFAVLDSDVAVKQTQSGEMRAIALLSDETTDYLPGIPSIHDYGVTGMQYFKGLKWVAIHKDTPDEIVEWLKQEINATIQSDEYQDYLDTAGLGRIRYYSEEELTEFLKGAYKAYGDVLAELDMAK